VEEQALNAREWLSALFRHKFIILTFVLVGVCAGVGYAVAVPGLYTSKALVLLPPSSLNSNGQPTRDIGTQAQIAMSPGIVDRAGEQLRPPLGFAVLQHRIVVTGLTSDILQITAKGVSGSQAQQLANGVASAFVAYTSQTAAAIPGVTAALRNEASQIQRQISDLQQEINTTTATIHSDGVTSTKAQSQIALLSTLEQQQQSANLQLDSVNSQIAQAKLNAAGGGTGTAILDKAASGTPPSHLRPVLYGILGLLAGILVGGLGAMRAIRRDRRLRRRDDMAEVVGAPVLASLSLRPLDQSVQWVDLLVRWEPSVEDGWTTRKMLRRSSDAASVSDVTVVALAWDQAALAVAPHLAASAAALGIPTTFVEDSEHESSLSLRRATAVLASEAGPTRAGLKVFSAEQPPASPSSGLVVNAVVLDPRDPLWPLTSRSTTTWLAVSSGFATAADLARVSVAAADSTQTISGIVVVNADHADPTTGRFPTPTVEAGPFANGHVNGKVQGVTR
jgi:capsular polysaccharide biosynthesis protein